MAARDNELAAKILCEAYFGNDEEIAGKYGITSRTVRNYRSAQKDDDELSRLFRQRVKDVETRAWADQLSETLTTALRKIGATLEQAPAENLADIAQMVGLTRELMELELSRKYAEHETGGDDRADNLGARQAQGATAQANTGRLLS